MRSLVAALILLSAASAAELSIRYESGAFRVIGWTPAAEPSDGWGSLFPVYAGSGDEQPMLGSYAVEDWVLVFHPRFPIGAGMRYHAIFRAPGRAPVEFRLAGPPRSVEALTRVAQIYPSVDVLPSNVLRLYVYFTAPMSRGEAWQHIHLVDEDNQKAVEMPFLELDQELWDQNNQRLTVLFDPGRIKRGLVPTNTIGPSVVEGKHYRLVIDREWHDARGVGLVEGFEKKFRGGPADRTPPAPARWVVNSPKAGTREPLVIKFPKSMDTVLLQRMISVFDGGGEVAGAVTVSRNETELAFVPRDAWKAGVYRIIADNTLEDIAGNHLDRAFDVDIFTTVTKHIETVTSSVPFKVR